MDTAYYQQQFLYAYHVIMATHSGFYCTIPIMQKYIGT